MSDAESPVPERAAEKPLDTRARISAYLKDELPKPISSLLKHGLGPLALYLSLAFSLVLFMPLLSIVSLSLVTKVLPEPMAKWSHENFVSAIHSGYDIDKVSKRLKEEAAKDVLNQLSTNNQTLDYVQYVEFYLSKADAPKEIPANLHLGQRAEITVRRNQLVKLDSAAAACAVADIPASQPVLEVKLDTLRLASMSAGIALGTSGKIRLTKAWWKQNLASATAQPTIAEDGIASVVFGKVPEFEKVMTECTALKVEAVVAVFKRDVGEGI